MSYKKSIRGLIAACVVTTGLLFGSVAAFAAGTGKATDTGVNIREDASTSAKAIGSTTKDVKFDIYSKKTDSAGNVWYKITVSGDTKGYVRSDYVTDVTGEIPSENGASTTDSTTTSSATTTTTTTESNSTTTTSTASSVTVNPSAYTFGTTTAEVSVRESASTKSNKVATTATNQDVAITGEAKGSDGMTWYQVNYGDVKGFIRSDLLTVGEKVSTPEETEPVEETETVVEEEEEDVFVAPEPTPVVNQDYEVRYEPNDQGENIWYLYDHNKGTRQSLDNIFAVMEQSQNMTTSNKEKSSGLKIVVIIMGIVIVALIAAVAVLAFKLRDSYEYEDDDDDDDEDEDDEDDDDNYTSSSSGSYADDDDEELDEEEIKVVSKQGKAKKPAGRPSRIGGDSWKNNFLDIDDDVEFEFLDLDK